MLPAALRENVPPMFCRKNEVLQENGITVWWRKPGDYGGIPAFEKDRP
jgi:hypothetical protein